METEQRQQHFISKKATEKKIVYSQKPTTFDFFIKRELSQNHQVGQTLVHKIIEEERPKNIEKDTRYTSNAHLQPNKIPSVEHKVTDINNQTQSKSSIELSPNPKHTTQQSGTNAIKSTSQATLTLAILTS